MNNCINVMAMSGQIDWVKIKFTSTQKVMMSFAIVQPNFKFENGELVSKSYDRYFCSCFDDTQWLNNRVKEGDNVTIQGYLKPYINSDKKLGVAIIVEKIDVHGPARNEG